MLCYGGFVQHFYFVCGIGAMVKHNSHGHVNKQYAFALELEYIMFLWK